MRAYFFAILSSVLGIGLILLPFHVGTTGICFLALGLMLALIAALAKKPERRRLRLALTALCVAGVVTVVSCVAVIAWNGRDDDLTADAPEFVIVLGAQTHGDRPSRTLRERLDLAYDYLLAQPDAVCFVSGGLGRDETCAEAQVMQRYLLEKGIDPSRVIAEASASNTRENLIFSRELAEQSGIDTADALIITSEFHLCRAKYIASALGIRAYGLGSTTTPWVLKLCYEVREVFAFVKAFLQAG